MNRANKEEQKNSESEGGNEICCGLSLERAGEQFQQARAVEGHEEPAWRILGKLGWEGEAAGFILG